MDTKVIKCIETFVSWQGEGQDCGKRMLIMRFKRCNRIEAGKGCPWCDTAIKLRISAEYSLSLNDIQKLLDKEKCGILLTGGCPTFDSNLHQTILMLNNLNYPIANVESNGYQLLKLIERVDLNKNVNYSYSPKIFNNEELYEEIEKSKKLSLISNVYFKIVYDGRALIDQYLEALEELDINSKVFIMPQGVTKEELIINSPDAINAAELYKFNFSSRSHIIYGFI